MTKLMTAMPLIAGSLMLAACSSPTTTADTAPADPATTMNEPATGDTAMTAPAPAIYLARAGASDMFEIESSQLALRKASSDEVKAFARMMIEHHTKSTADLKAAAQQANIAVPAPKLEPAQADMIRELDGLTGAEFDRAYVRQQAMAHDMALNLHRSFADGGQAGPLKTAAAAIVPVVQGHLERVRTMPGADAAGGMAGTSGSASGMGAAGTTGANGAAMDGARTGMAGNGSNSSAGTAGSAVPQRDQSDRP